MVIAVVIVVTIFVGAFAVTMTGISGVAPRWPSLQLFPGKPDFAALARVEQEEKDNPARHYSGSICKYQIPKLILQTPNTPYIFMSKTGDVGRPSQVLL